METLNSPRAARDASYNANTIHHYTKNQKNKEKGCEWKITALATINYILRKLNLKITIEYINKNKTNIYIYICFNPPYFLALFFKLKI